MPEIVDIKGVGPVLAKACIERGYGSIEKIAGAGILELVAVPGVSETRAKQLIDAAKLLLNGASPVNAATASEAKSELGASPVKMAGPKKKKNKNKKKSKKDNKKKSKKKNKKKSKKNN